MMQSKHSRSDRVELGASGHGTGAWLQQRLTAGVLAALGLWFVLALARLPHVQYEDLRAWVGAPVNSVLLLAFVGAAIAHAILGLRVVFEDYVSGFRIRLAMIVIADLALIVGGLFAAVAILRLGHGLAS